MRFGGSFHASSVRVAPRERKWGRVLASCRPAPRPPLTVIPALTHVIPAPTRVIPSPHSPPLYCHSRTHPRHSRLRLRHSCALPRHSLLRLRHSCALPRHSREGGNLGAHVRPYLTRTPARDTKTPPIETLDKRPRPMRATPLLRAAPMVALPLDTCSVNLHYVDFDVPVSVGGKRNFASVRRPCRVDVPIGVVGEAGDV